MLKRNFISRSDGDRKRFYNVSDFIADLLSGKLGAKSIPATPKLTAEAAYKLGVIDGWYGLANYSQHAAPFTAEYAQGYADGQGAPVEHNLRLGTIVCLHNGVEGVIVAQASGGEQRYQVTWFDRHYWIVRRKFYCRDCFKVIGAASSAAAEAATLSA